MTVSLSPTQLEELSGTSFVNKIDDKMTIVSELGAPELVGPHPDDYRVVLYLKVFWEGEEATMLSFNLINYDYDDLIYTAKNIGKNEYILREVDEYLSGAGD